VLSCASACSRFYLSLLACALKPSLAPLDNCLYIKFGPVTALFINYGFVSLQHCMLGCARKFLLNDAALADCAVVKQAFSFRGQKRRYIYIRINGNATPWHERNLYDISPTQN